ncbi:MAG: hypothetical protein Q3990_04855 [Desulfovibrionaceae bacterium]|nr:hypothetical protein [Desulfovibrionaceae bacterium]
MAAPVLMMPALNVFPAKKGADKGSIHCSAENQLGASVFIPQAASIAKNTGVRQKKLMRLPDTPELRTAGRFAEMKQKLLSVHKRTLQ